MNPYSSAGTGQVYQTQEASLSVASTDPPSSSRIHLLCLLLWLLLFFSSKYIWHLSYFLHETKSRLHLPPSHWVFQHMKCPLAILPVTSLGPAPRKDYGTKQEVIFIMTSSDDWVQGWSRTPVIAIASYWEPWGRRLIFVHSICFLSAEFRGIFVSMINMIFQVVASRTKKKNDLGLKLFGFYSHPQKSRQMGRIWPPLPNPEPGTTIIRKLIQKINC